jgi:hypothetical protein
MPRRPVADSRATHMALHARAYEKRPAAGGAWSVRDAPRRVTSDAHFSSLKIAIASPYG